MGDVPGLPSQMTMELSWIFLPIKSMHLMVSLCYR